MPRKTRRIRELKPKDKECICHGNWRSIVKETEPFYDKQYVDDLGNIAVLVGVVDAEDDYYYLLRSLEGRMILLTCVGSIEGQGYTILYTPIRRNTDIFDFNKEMES